MDGTFPSTCFQNKIDAKHLLRTRILSSGPQHLDAFCCASRILGRKSPSSQCLCVPSGEVLNTLACVSCGLALWLPARWAAGQAGKLAGNQAGS